jgi:Holliday junction resolvase RusA-like endonuclease
MRRGWCRAIHAAIVEVQKQGPVQYLETDKLEVEIRFHLRDRKLTVLDLDNRVKHVFDVLQGFIGDKGKTGELRAIIPNDNQIYRLIVEKRLPPKKDRTALSTIIIRGYHHHKGTARAPREFRKNVKLKDE